MSSHSCHPLSPTLYLIWKSYKKVHNNWKKGEVGLYTLLQTQKLNNKIRFITAKQSLRTMAVAVTHAEQFLQHINSINENMQFRCSLYHVQNIYVQFMLKNMLKTGIR